MKSQDKFQLIQPYKIYELPVTKIQYMAFTPKRTIKSQPTKRLVHQKIKQKMPIQIVLDKISLQKKQNILNRKESSPQNFKRSPSPNININLNNPTKNGEKQMIKVKPYLFQKFNYQSYANYGYKTSQKVFKYQEQDRRLGGFKVYQRPLKLPNKVKQTDRKNLQIIFCENKYKDFVQKVNQIAEQQYIKKRAKSMSSLPVNTRCKKIEMPVKQTVNPEQTGSISEGINGYNYSKYNSKTLLAYKQNSKIVQNSKYKLRFKSDSVSALKNKSSLINCLQQFKNLQKLTQYRDEQLHLNALNLYQTNKNLGKDEFLKTVSVAVLVDRFIFLKKKKKSLRQRLIQLIIGSDQQITGNSKINIHHYLKFNRIFIVKDATTQQLAYFIYNFLFDKTLSFESSSKVIDSLDSADSSQLKNYIKIFLFQLFNRNNQNQEEVVQQICENSYFCRIFINFITKK